MGGQPEPGNYPGRAPDVPCQSRACPAGSRTVRNSANRSGPSRRVRTGQSALPEPNPVEGARSRAVRRRDHKASLAAIFCRCSRRATSTSMSPIPTRLKTLPLPEPRLCGHPRSGSGTVLKRSPCRARVPGSGTREEILSQASEVPAQTGAEGPFFPHSGAPATVGSPPSTPVTVRGNFAGPRACRRQQSDFAAAWQFAAGPRGGTAGQGLLLPPRISAATLGFCCRFEPAAKKQTGRKSTSARHVAPGAPSPAQRPRSPALAARPSTRPPRPGTGRRFID